MKNFWIFLSVLSLMSQDLYSQCGESETTLLIESEEDLDMLSGCVNIEGNLYISILSVSYLEALNSLESVEGDFTIEGCVSLLGLDDLSNLTEVGGSLIIESNFTLLDLNGLTSLNTIGGDLQITGNWSLENLNEFGSLTHIGGDLVLSQNNILESVDGLESLEEVTGSVIIYNDNIDLSDLSGLNGIQTIGGNLDFFLEDLSSMNGFESLEYVGDSLIIQNFPVLANLNGFHELSEVGTLYIEGNDNLVNIDSLYSLMQVNEDLFVSNNQVMFLCCGLFPLLEYGTVGGEITISDNSLDCNSIDSILEECYFEPISVSEIESPELVILGAELRINGDFSFWEMYSFDGKMVSTGNSANIAKTPHEGPQLLLIHTENGAFPFKIYQF